MKLYRLRYSPYARKVQMVLDLMFFDLARLNLNGNFGVTAGRCYFNQKTCCYDQTVGDLMTVMFDTRDGVIVWDGDEAAGSFASSRGRTPICPGR